MKQKKIFIIAYINSFILLILNFSLIIYSQYYNGQYMSYLPYIILLVFILLIINLILVISSALSNIKKGKIIKINQKLNTLTFFIVYFVVLSSLTSNAIVNHIEMERKNKMIDDAIKVIKKVESLNNDNYIYNFKELKNSNLIMKKSPFNNKYKKSSYVTTFKKTYICLNDGKYTVSGTKNKLEVVDSKICDFKINEKDISSYLKGILNTKYNESFIIYDCKENYDYDSVFNGKTGYNCKFKKENEEREYTVKIYDKDLYIIDTYVK